MIRRLATLGLFPVLKPCGGPHAVLRYRNFGSELHRKFTQEVPQPTAKRLEGKVALITGAASGIGEMVARLFHAHGAHIVLADIQDEPGLKLATELTTEDSGTRTVFVHCDVTREEDIADAVAAAASIKGGQLDIVYCSAGILGAVGPLHKINADEFDQTLAVNLRGTLLTVKHTCQIMKQAMKGSIICTGSTSSVIGGIGPHPYSVSKAALAGLVRSASVELRKFGVRINMVSPDGVPTPLFVAAYETLKAKKCTTEGLQELLEEMSVMGGATGSKRILNLVDVAQAALFLASDESSYMSGHNLLLDCGNTVTKPTQNARWYTTYMPMFREAGKTGLHD